MRLPSHLALLTLSCAGALAGQAAPAQEWTFETYEEPGRYRSAQLVRHDERLAFYCGAVLSDETGLMEEPIFTAPGRVNLVVSEVLMGPYGLDVPDPQTVRAFGMGRDIAAPPFYFDVMGGAGWMADLPAGHDILSAAAGGAEVVLAPEQGAKTFSIYGTGLAEGVGQMLDYCDQAPQAETGGRMAPDDTAPDAVPDTAADPATAAPADADPALLRRAEDLFREKCLGDYTVGPEAYRVIELTGDDRPELVLTYGSLTCTSGLFAGQTPPACAGDMCRFDILTRENPDPLILYATSLEPAEGTPGDILLGLDEASCSSMNQAAGCAARQRWVGNTFGTIGVE